MQFQDNDADPCKWLGDVYLAPLMFSWVRVNSFLADMVKVQQAALEGTTFLRVEAKILFPQSLQHFT